MNVFQVCCDDDISYCNNVLSESASQKETETSRTILYDGGSPPGISD